MISFFSALGTEALLEILKQSGNATAVYTGLDLNIQLANDAMLKIWRTDESVLDKKLVDALPELKGQPFVEILQNVWLNQEIYHAKNVSATLVTDGILSNSYFDIVYAPILDSDGKIYCIVHTAVDVSERVEAWKLVREKEEYEQKTNQKPQANEEYHANNDELNRSDNLPEKTYQKLLQTEQRLQQLLNSAPVGLTILQGENMIIETANPEMLAIWGYTEEQLLGKPLLDVFPLLRDQVFSNQLNQVYTSGKKVSLSEILFKVNHELQQVVKYLTIDFSPLFDSEGKIDAVMATVQDVTEKTLAAKALDKAKLSLQETNSELTALNEEFQNTNEELAAINEEYIATNEHLDKANLTINTLNEKLKQENKDLLVDNKEFQNNISDLDSSNKILQSRNDQLKILNDTITKLNTKLSDSETSFGNLIAQAPVAMLLITGDEFIVNMANAKMLELLGKDEKIIGKPLFKELPELVGQPAADMLIETYRKGIPHADYSNAVTLKRKGQLEQGYFNFNYTPYIEDGKVVGVIDIAIEVTPQVLAIQEREQTILDKTMLEETLRNSEQRLQGILETMAEGVGVINAEGQLIYANPMAQQILGLTETTIKDRTYDDPKWQNLRLDGSPLPSEEHPMSIMMATGKPVHDFEIGVQPPDRDRFYISINAAPIFDAEGNLTGGIGTFMDVTTRRMITQGKDDFISIASHELKTPVTSLKASLQLLQRSHERLPVETRARLIDQSIGSLDKLSRLIMDLLDTSRMEQGHLKLDKQPFTLSELFDDCCANIIADANQKIVFEGDADLIIEADNQQVGQVMANFITNAVKYAPHSETIIIKAAQINDAEIKISVIDEGPGIPKEKLTHLFERYYRTEYQGQKFTGLGLGLYISADIIKNHGGRIGVESELGKGSEFWFTLPYKAMNM